MIESMKNLLSKFPYFLDKRSVSNFYKSESVFNNRFKEVYNDMFQLGLSFHLSKSLWIYREQSEDYNFKMHFFAFLDKIKQVTILKNDVIIYSKGYTLNENVDAFEYSYTDTSLNKIPTDKYVLIVETYDEYYLEKGFPENDEPQDNIYDHDESLDNIGLFLNVPRKTYVSVDEFEYNRTEPPYHPIITLDDGLTVNATEDDYHYMCRLLEYVSRYHNESLPTLEIWKNLGVDASIQNRETKLCKMFEESKHYEGWSPKDWEHKDPQCILNEEYYFLFVTVDNYTPFRGQNVRFTLNVLNSLGRTVTDRFIFLPFLNGVRFNEKVIDGYVFTVNSKDLDMTAENIFIFKGFSSLDALNNDLLENNGLFVIEDGDLISDEIIITVKGCNDGDYYVSVNGDDSNNGSKEYPFKTIEHAFNLVQSNEIIVLMDEEYSLSNIVNVDSSCTLVSCAGDYSTIIPSQSEIFKIEQDVKFTMIGINMKYKCCELYSDNNIFWNNNPVNNPVSITLNRPVGCKPLTEILLDDIDDIDARESITINGSIMQINRRTQEKTPLSSAIIKLYLNDVDLLDITSNNQGGFEDTYILDTADDYTLKLVYEENESYCGSTAETKFRVYHITYLKVLDDGTLKYKTSHETLELSIDNDSNLIMSYDEEQDPMAINISENGDIIVEDYYDS